MKREPRSNTFALILILFIHNTLSLQLTDEHRKLIQRGFLHRFGMVREPSLANNRNMPVPEYLWDIYEDALDDRIDADTIRHYYPQELFELNSGLQLSYNLSASVRNESIEIVRRAILKTKLNGSGRVRVFEVDAEYAHILRLLDTKVASSDNEWTDFDVTASIQRKRKERDRVDFVVKFSPSQFLEKGTVHSPSSMHLSLKESAALIVYVHQTEGDNRTRRKRSAQDSPPERRKGRGRKKGRKGHHRQNAQKNLCQRKDLYVDFKELNWDDWILSPLGYNAYMCVGDCPNPLPSHLNATNHAIVQSLLNSLNPSVPPPCCVPTEMSSLHILYRDIDNQIVMKNYPDMRVQSCGCR